MEMLVLYGAVFFLVLLSTGLAGALYLVTKSGQDETSVTPETIINAVDDAVAVVDDTGSILLANAAFTALSDGQPEGDALDAVLAYPSLIQTLDAGEEIAEVETETGTKHLQCEQFSTTTESGEELTVVLFHDVTDHCESQHELQRQNERLDEFASLITHDIRNPLDVAIGRTNAALEMTTDPEIKELLTGVRDSHNRMLRIINNVLTLARQGDAIEQFEIVEVAETARTAWSHVETEDGTLDVAHDGEILADGTRLERLFENLFRNAVEHGGADVNVRVTPLAEEAGFAVADDGPGIPETERTAVFEAGYSKGSSGTGLGLAIVSRIAQAHGWEVTVTESATGGAQFEFRGVESPAQATGVNSEQAMDTAAAETEQ